MTGRRSSTGLPRLDEYLTAFAGHVYAPDDYWSAAVRGSSAHGDPPAPSSLELEFRLRARGRPLCVESGREPLRHHELTALSTLLQDLAGPRRLRFPIAIERRRILIRVAGRKRAFTAYEAAGHAVANGRVGEVDVRVRGPSDTLAALDLVPLDAVELEALLRAHPPLRLDTYYE